MMIVPFTSSTLTLMMIFQQNESWMITGYKTFSLFICMYFSSSLSISIYLYFVSYLCVCLFSFILLCYRFPSIFPQIQIKRTGLLEAGGKKKTRKNLALQERILMLSTIMICFHWYVFFFFFLFFFFFFFFFFVFLFRKLYNCFENH
jgi:hypothetical protein